MNKNSDMLPWNYTSDFVEVWWSKGLHNEVDFRPVEFSHGYVSYGNYDDMMELMYPHNDTVEGVIEAIRKTYGIILKPRPDLTYETFEVVGSL